MNILLSTCHDWPFARQIPGSSSTWNDISYSFNDENASADFLVVYDEPHKTLRTNIPRARRFLFISEPPSIKTYTPKYLNQFGTIFTPQEILELDEEVSQVISQLSLPWHYGVSHADKFEHPISFDALTSLSVPEKRNEISTIISAKTMNAHHKQRLAAVKFLKDKLGQDFHLLGKGHEEINDKAEGIAPYAFHLVCENNDVPHFWTEKLADAYLGWAFPIFSGCSNIDQYFPKGSFLRVNLDNHEETLKTIKSCLNTPSFYEEKRSAIKEARDLILNEYNLYAVIQNYVLGSPLDTDAQLSKAEYLTPQSLNNNILNKATNKAMKIICKIIHRLKNLPFVLPWYFKLVNLDASFFTDYYDRLGKKAMQEGYFGQRGQDWFLDQKIFKGKTNGVFLDIGANDPKELSNTLFFEQKGWDGLAFEPQERFRDQWKNERKILCLPHLLGANEEESVTFIEYNTDDWQNALSGVEGYALEEGENIIGVDKKRSVLRKRRLDSVLKEHDITHVDFISLDVEGFEMEVLQGIDFNQVLIDVIVVENDRSHLGDNALRHFIKSKGYKHIARLSGDDVFQRIGADL